MITIQVGKGPLFLTDLNKFRRAGAGFTEQKSTRLKKTRSSDIGATKGKSMGMPRRLEDGRGDN